MIAYPKELRKNLLFRQQLLAKCRDSAPLRKEVLERCAKDGLFWLNVFGYTRDPRIKTPILPFITYDYQDELWNELNVAFDVSEGRRIEKSRTMGVSWTIVSWMVWRWLFYPDQIFLMLSRKEEYVDGKKGSLFKLADLLISRLPAWMRPKICRTKMRLENLDNESIIEGESTNADAGRGDRRTAVLWDEVAACENAHEIAAALASVTYCQILNSTPQGCADYFYESRDYFRTLRFHWSRHPDYSVGLYKPTPQGPIILKPGAPLDYPYSPLVPAGAEGVRSPWYDKTIRQFNPIKVAAEFDIDYMSSDYPFFDPVSIEKHIAMFCRPALYRGRLNDDGAEPRFEEDNRGPLSVWVDMGSDCTPPNYRNFVVACDIGQGTGASDSVAVVVDRDSGEKVAEWVHNKTGVEAFARVAVSLCYFFGRGAEPAFLIWDGGGPGLTFGKVVTQDLGFRRVYMKRDDTKVDARWTPKDRKPGWFSNRDLKRDLLIQYREALASGKFFNPSEKALLECKQFKNMADGSVEHVSIAMAQDGGDNHGDRVIADALACFVSRPTVVANEKREPSVMDEFPVGSFGWRQKQAMMSDKPKWSSRW